MAKANSATGTSYYLPEGAAVPEELADADLRYVGPGSPEEKARVEAEAKAAAKAKAEQPAKSSKAAR